MVQASRVLVVDDEPAIRALVAKIVQRAGLDVDLAGDGVEAIEKLDGHPYAVLVLDLMMPTVDGFGIISHLRSRTNLPRPAIIVISAADTTMLRHLDGTLVHTILRKPFDIDVLGDLITAAAQSAEATKTEGDVLQFKKQESGDAG